MDRRGEGWVILQVIFLLAIILAPKIVNSEFSNRSHYFGFLVLSLGALLEIAAFWNLGRNFSPFPQPIRGGFLVRSGIYRFVRHPMYTGLVLCVLGWGLWKSNLIRIGLAIGLFLFFDVKSRCEDRWLKEAYPEQTEEYQKKVKRLILWLY